MCRLGNRDPSTLFFTTVTCVSSEQAQGDFGGWSLMIIGILRYFQVGLLRRIFFWVSEPTSALLVVRESSSFVWRTDRPMIRQNDDKRMRSESWIFMQPKKIDPHQQPRCHVVEKQPRQRFPRFQQNCPGEGVYIRLETSQRCDAVRVGV